MNIDFSKNNGLVPVVVQDTTTLQVLMLGYMNQEALNKTVDEGRITFYSRSKNRLWTKGETSQNYLLVDDIKIDCDNDTLLIKAFPQGPTCHTGTTSCFGEASSKGFLYYLEQVIEQRLKADTEESYTATLFKRGVNKVAQKVGEEAVELVIEAMGGDEELFKNEAADLLYHFILLLKTKELSLEDVEKILIGRHK